MNIKLIAMSLIVMMSVLAIINKPNGQQLTQVQPDDNEIKFYWYSRVSEEAFLSQKNKIKLDEKNPQIVMEGIKILLNFEGDKNKANFCGATGYGYNSPEVECEVEVAALFYASYIFYGQDWDYFATGIALVENNRNNSPKTIKKAFSSYRKWFKRVKEIGLEEARKQKLDPLAGSGVRWY